MVAAILTADFGGNAGERKPSGRVLPFAEVTQTHASVKPGIHFAWWLNVLAWIDWTDLTTHKRAGYVFFMDLLISRPTEFAVMLALFVRAYERSGGRLEMTASQVEAVTLAYEAVAVGLNPARYVAQRKGTSLRAAYYLLQRADTHIGKMFNIEQNFHSVDRAKKYLPTEADIKRRMAGFRHECPCAPLHEDCKHTIRGDQDLCHPCSKRYGVEGERPIWLQALISDTRKTLREDALSELVSFTVAYDDEFDYVMQHAA